LNTHAIGGMWGYFFADAPVRDYADARRSDAVRFRHFFHAALEGGVYLPPAPYEACFVSLAHTPADIDDTLAVFDHAMTVTAAANGATLR
jgi:glutamate-1-semialdehyde 2,1-aminomutase